MVSGDLCLLQQLHHPLVHGPLDGIDNEGTHTAYAQATEEDARALCPICVSGNFHRAHSRLGRLWLQEPTLLALFGRVMQYLRLQPRLDHIQGEDGCPGNHAGQTPTHEHLHGCLLMRVIGRAPGLLGEFIRPKAIFSRQSRSLSFLHACMHFGIGFRVSVSIVILSLFSPRLFLASTILF